MPLSFFSTMQHVYVIYLFLMFSIGLTSLGIVVFLYTKTRETVLRYYLYCFAPFSLLTASAVGRSYINANLPAVHLASVELGSDILAVLTMFAVTLFVHFLIKVSRIPLRQGIIAGLGLFILAFDINEIYFTPNQSLIHINPYLDNLILLVVMLYAAIVGWYASRKEADAHRRMLTRTVVWLLAAFILGSPLDAVLDQWVGDGPPLFSPLIYGILSVIFTHLFLKLYGHHHSASLPQPVPVVTPEPISLESLCTQYALSAREQEVLRLILEGYSNQKIGETLFISLSTVKTHTGNIFQKCGVKSRYELMALFKHTGQQPSQS